MLVGLGKQSLQAIAKVPNSLRRTGSIVGGNCGQRLLYPAITARNKRFNQTKAICDPPDLMDPTCKIAIVTGGSTGIGYSACDQLLKEGAAHVVIGGISVKAGEEAIKKLNEKYGREKAVFIKCDVTSPCEFDNIFKETISRYEQVDILFNNAGMLDDKRWELTVDTNVKGVLRGCFLALKYMGQNECGSGGVIVNCASIVGLQPLVGAPVYCCTKHAVIGITRCLGADFHYSKTGIRVCSLCPGVTVTELVTNAHGRQYNEEWGAEAKRELDSLPKQTIEMTGKPFTYIVRRGKSGHHYIREDSQTLHAEIPDRNCFSTVVASYKIEMTGKSFTYIVRRGKSGHHYISEDSQTLHAEIPDRNTFSTVVASYK